MTAFDMQIAVVEIYTALFFRFGTQALGCNVHIVEPHSTPVGIENRNSQDRILSISVSRYGNIVTDISVTSEIVYYRCTASAFACI